MRRTRRKKQVGEKQNNNKTRITLHPHPKKKNPGKLTLTVNETTHILELKRWDPKM